MPRLRFSLVLAWLLITCWTLAGSGPAQAGWLIDPAKLHVSPHGQMGCLECHDDIDARETHPDPGKVATSSLERFSPERCLMCHDQVELDLEEGRHGRQEEIDPAQYASCILCHDPHYPQYPHHPAREGVNKIGDFDPGQPIWEQCGACHQQRAELPKPLEEDEGCLVCHRLILKPGPQRNEQMTALCLTCHGPGSKQDAPKIDPADLAGSPHADLDCLACHTQAADYLHHRQRPAACDECHQRHDESKAHEAHLRVDCQACHSQDVRPVREPISGRVAAQAERPKERPAHVHSLVETTDEASCLRCHHPGNQVGASARVLPAKGLICLGCHAATFSVADTTSIISLLIFVFGLILAGSVWLSASGATIASALHQAAKAVFSARIGAILKALIIDGLLQRRLYRHSPGRWLIHGLIFWPFVFRFIWGMLALMGTRLWPETSWAWVLVDKNHPATALAFDLSGLLVLTGVGLAMLRRRLAPGRPAGLPGQDKPAVALLAGIIVVGYILEGMRMALAGGGEWAVVGALLSRAFEGADWLTEVYGYIWYLHAILTGALLAYLPFSRMFHIIFGPLTAAIRAAQADHDRQPSD